MRIFTKRKIIIYSAILLLIVIAVVIGASSGGDGAEASGEKQNSKLKESAVMVLVQEFKRQDVPEYVQVSGTLQGRDQVEMVAGVSGQLRKLNKGLGDWVEKGESIGDIEADFKKAQYENAKALFTVAKSNLKAGKQLYASQQISESEYQGMVADYASCQANFISAKNDYDYARMAAPVSGFITDLPVEEGESLSPSSFVCKIVNYKKLLLNTGVGEASIVKLTKDQKVDVSPDGLETLLSGKVIGVGRAPAHNSAVYPVKIELEGVKNLLPGMTVTAQVAVGVFEDVQAVTYDALVQVYDDYYVYKLMKDNTVKKIKVKIVKMVGNIVIIESSLIDGDFVVIDGVDEIEDGQSVSPNYYKTTTEEAEVQEEV